MATRRQELAIEGELLVVDRCRCLRCGGAFRPLRRSSPCATVRCIECGAPAQVGTRRWAATGRLPRKLMGGAWAPQAGLLLGDALHDLFVVLVGTRERAVYALPASFQDARLFRMRDALAPASRLAGRQVFTYELEAFWPVLTKVEPQRAGRIQVVHALPSLAQRERRRRGLADLMRPAVPAAASNVVSLGSRG